MTLSSPSRALAANNCRDELKRPETARDYLASIFDCSNDAIIAKRLDGRITAWNTAAERMFGYAASEIIGKPVTTLFPPDLLPEESEIMARIVTGRTTRTFETRRVRKDGREIQVSITVSPIRNAAGEIIGASKIVRDLTDRKAAEERFSNMQAELIHLARWNTMGMMASSLAHELNQPLAAMTNYLSALRRVLAAQPQNHKLLGELVEKSVQQGQRAATIVQHVRELVAKGKSTRLPESLAGVVREALQIVSVAIRQSGVEIKFEAENNLPPIEIDRVQIQQVVINLVRNAAEAMAKEPERRLNVRVVREGSNLRTDVADTGPGLPKEVADHLFEAFVTTKSTGMGLGLSICHQIVTAHGGALTARPNKPHGTVFTFILPLEPHGM
ncbi:MAG TPA: PAS domain S-box protein [Rhizomicrobium sp.]|jgi:two-component system sensor kinase FixL